MTFSTVPAAHVVTPSAKRRRLVTAKVTRRPVGVVALFVVVVAVAGVSLIVGVKPVPIDVVFTAFRDFDSTNTDHLIVRELRVPRTVLGLLIGSSLGVAGALMQAVARNPLADPGILGVNAGASFAVVLAVWLTSNNSVSTLVWFALAGAAAASVVVFLLGSIGKGGPTPVRMALAGTAMSALLFALTRTVTLLDTNTLDAFRFWAVGSLAGHSLDVSKEMLPFAVVGGVLAVGSARPLNAISLGEDSATGLGVNVLQTQVIAGTAIAVLCGIAVAAAGPIGFVGLVIPHATRFFFGPDQRWLIPACALSGASFVLACDVLGRLIVQPAELQVGITTAAFGGVAFVIIVRRLKTIRL